MGSQGVGHDCVTDIHLKVGKCHGGRKPELCTEPPDVGSSQTQPLNHVHLVASGLHLQPGPILCIHSAHWTYLKASACLGPL